VARDAIPIAAQDGPVAEGMAMEHPTRDLSRWTPPPRPDRSVLEGRHLRLEPLAAGHAAALHAANAADDAIWDYLPYGPFAEEAEYGAWVESVVGRDDPMFFALVDRATGRAGGVASLMRISPEAGSIEVGHICLSPSIQRTRAASEMIYLFARRVFDLGYRRFEWKCNAANAASRRAAQRFGFSYEGVFRQHLGVKGRNRDTAWFAMTDGDWACLEPAWEAWLAPENFDAGGRQKRRLGDLTAPCRVASDLGTGP
jgi:RimJ/RimL family protein N-acetyltransferase